MKIVLDPGHSNKDSGAIGPSGVQEKSITLQIGKKLAILLAKEGYEPFLTRVDDSWLPITARPKIAEEMKADAFLSIHCNASESPLAHGIETIYAAKRPKSKEFAESIQHYMMLGNPVHKDRGVKASPSPEYIRELYVTNCIDPEIPSALVEVEFISNVIMEKWIVESIDHISQCLFNGIDNYFQSQKKENKYGH